MSLANSFPMAFGQHMIKNSFPPFLVVLIAIDQSTSFSLTSKVLERTISKNLSPNYFVLRRYLVQLLLVSTEDIKCMVCF